MDHILKLKLSNDDKQLLKFHFLVALCVLTAISGLTFFAGLISSKKILVGFGGITFSASIFIGSLIFIFEYLQNLKKIKAPLQNKYNEIYDAVEIAKKAITPIKEEIKQRTSKTLSSSNNMSINLLTLDWLIENLSARLDETYLYLKSNDDEKITIAEELLKKDLEFNKNCAEHLLELNIPNMPANTWIDSLKFLTNKVVEEYSNLKDKDSSFLYAIRPG